MKRRRVQTEPARPLGVLALLAMPSAALLVALLTAAADTQAQPVAAADFTPRPIAESFDPANLEPVAADAQVDTIDADEASWDSTPFFVDRPVPEDHPQRFLQTDVPLSKIGEKAIRGGEVRWSVLLAAAGLVICIGVGASLHRRLTHGPGDPSTGQTFLAHCRRIGLSWPQTLLLVRIAREAKLPTPLALLVAYGTLNHHGRQFAAGLSMGRRDRVHRALSAIHRKAFPHASPQRASPRPGTRLET